MKYSYISFLSSHRSTFYSSFHIALCTSLFENELTIHYKIIKSWSRWSCINPKDSVSSSARSSSFIGVRNRMIRSLTLTWFQIDTVKIASVTQWRVNTSLVNTRGLTQYRTIFQGSIRFSTGRLRCATQRASRYRWLHAETLGSCNSTKIAREPPVEATWINGPWTWRSRIRDNFVGSRMLTTVWRVPWRNGISPRNLAGFPGLEKQIRVAESIILLDFRWMGEMEMCMFVLDSETGNRNIFCMTFSSSCWLKFMKNFLVL